MNNFLAVAPYIAIPLLLSLADFIIILRAKFSNAAEVSSDGPQSDDFTILLPIFGSIRYLKNVEFLKPYGSKVLLCTTTRETRTFNERLKAIAAEHGFNIYRSSVPIASSKARPNPWRIFSSTLTQTKDEDDDVWQYELGDEARDEIMQEGSRVVTTKYSILIDGDTVTRKPLDRLAGLMEEKKFDLASVRVLASKADTMMEKLQSVEYELAMDARKIYPWLTSGAAMIAKTGVMKEIMGHHSLFFSGGDIEIGKLAKMAGYKVGHIAFTFYTDVPRTFRAWFRQRVVWFGGGFRHAVINAHQYSWKHPLFYFYNTILVYALAPIRWYEAVKRPVIIPIVIFLYWFLILAFHWRRARLFYLIFPFYALFQVMVLVPLGMYAYFKMAFTTENTGMIKFRDNDANFL